MQWVLSKQIVVLEHEFGVTLLHPAPKQDAGRRGGNALAEGLVLRRPDHATDTAELTEAGALGSLVIGFIGPAMWNILPRLMRDYGAGFRGALPPLSMTTPPSSNGTGQDPRRRLRPSFGHDGTVEIRNDSE